MPDLTLLHNPNCSTSVHAFDALTNAGHDFKVRKYLLEIVHGTRMHDDIQLGGSPRASIALFRTAQALAAVNASNRQASRRWVGFIVISRGIVGCVRRSGASWGRVGKAAMPRLVQSDQERRPGEAGRVLALQLAHRGLGPVGQRLLRKVRHLSPTRPASFRCVAV